jgi:predicted transcriptional regulator
MTEGTFTFRVSDELKARFTEKARSHDRTGAQLLREFMRDYVRGRGEEPGYDAWFRRQVERARESANAGRLIAAEDVEAEFKARRAKTRRKLRSRRS